MSITVRVPATSANIGPGFDCLGVALGLYARFTCEEIENGLEITGCDEKYSNEENLFVRAFRQTEKRIGKGKKSIRLHIDTEVPVSRGLGSSATLIAGGAVTANALHGGVLSQSELLAVCNELEGHPDNVAPALYGGMCTSIVRNTEPLTAPIEVAPNIGFIAFIPNFETRTRDMRAVLPKQVPFADAVFNASHVAMLIRGFESGDMCYIENALEDRLHQPYRTPLIYEYECVRELALDAGCAGFCVSGSGSTCLGIAEIEKARGIAEAVGEKLADSPYEWKCMALTIDRYGVTIE